VILTAREASRVRRDLLTLGDHEASDRLGFDVLTLARMAAQLPVSPEVARRLRNRYTRPLRADEL